MVASEHSHARPHENARRCGPHRAAFRRRAPCLSATALPRCGNPTPTEVVPPVAVPHRYTRNRTCHPPRRARLSGVAPERTCAHTPAARPSPQRSATSPAATPARSHEPRGQPTPSTGWASDCAARPGAAVRAAHRDRAPATRGVLRRGRRPGPTGRDPRRVPPHRHRQRTDVTARRTGGTAPTRAPGLPAKPAASRR